VNLKNEKYQRFLIVKKRQFSKKRIDFKGVIERYNRNRMMDKMDQNELDCKQKERL